MWPNSRFPADFITFTEEIQNGKLHFLCGDVIHLPIGLSFTTFLLTHFILLVSFYTSWKHQKTFSFLMFSRGIERDQWHEMVNREMWRYLCSELFVEKIWIWLRTNIVYIFLSSKFLEDLIFRWVFSIQKRKHFVVLHRNKQF